MSAITHPYVSVIIVCWNNAKHILQCLKQLSLQTLQDMEIIIIDNGSQDGTTDGLANKYPGLNIHIEYMSSNMGFAVANNIGVRLARGQWLALLNTDAFPEPDWLEQLIKVLKDNPEYSCLSSRQLQANNPQFLDGAGDAYHISGMAWKRFLGYPSDQFGLEKVEVFSSCGAAALYSREAFLDVGGFDEDFFSYLEDVDLGFRLRLRGYRCLYVPQAIVHHVGSATLGVGSDFALYHYQRNFIWSFIKNVPSGLLWKYIFPHILANILYLAGYIIRGRGKIVWKAKLDAIRGFPKALRKRHEIQSRKKVPDKDLERSMEHGWLSPYLRNYHLRNILRRHKL